MLHQFDTKAPPANSTTVFFSNSFEALASSLKESLFDEGGAPFMKKMILVPGFAIKKYLKEYFVSSCKVALGTPILTIGEALTLWMKKQFPRNFFYLPSLIELKVHIQRLLLEALSDPATEKLFSSISDYILPLTREDKRRCLDKLSKELAEFYLFLDLYGKKWTLSKEFNESWQGVLWKKLSDPSNPWIFTSKLLDLLPSIEETLYFFGFTYLPPLLMEGFSSLHPYHFLFSPCKEYWEDFCTEQEKIYYHGLLKALRASKSSAASFEAFTANQHPLLASLGKASREFLKTFSEGNYVSHEGYFPKALENTLLGALQKDLLCGSLSEEPILIQEKDRSLTIHSCPSKLREVEVLRDFLYSMIDESALKNETLSTQDIIVLSPSIEAYIPYIQLVFGEEGSQLGYTLFQVALEKSEPERFVSALLSPNGKRFEKEWFLDLLELSSFTKKANLSAGEIAQIQEWVEMASIRWGMDEAHKNTFSQSEKTEKGMAFGSWSQGFSRLLRGVVFSENEELPLPGVAPIAAMEMTDCSTLKKWMEITHKLFRIVKAVQTEEKTVSDWLSFIKEALQDCLELEEKDALETLAKFSALFQSYSALFPFDSVEETVLAWLTKKPAVQSSKHPNRIGFWPIKRGRVTHEKIVCFLGLNEGSFLEPMHNPFIKEILGNKQVDKGVSASDELRYLFLEALSSARQAFWISYTGLDAHHNPCEPAIVVKELFSTLKRQINETDLPKVFFEEKAFGFHREYFQETSPTSSYSKSYFAIAKSPKVEKPASFVFEDFLQTLPPLAKDTYEVDIEDFLYFLKNKEGFYLKKVIGLHEPYTPPLEHMEEFTLSYSLRRKLHKEILQRSFEEAWEKQEEKEGVPHGILKEVVKKRLSKECLIAAKWYQEKNISSLFAVKLDKACEEAMAKKEGFILPSLTLNLEGNIQIVLTGLLQEVSQSGCLIFEDKLQEATQLAKAMTFIITHHPVLKEITVPSALLIKHDREYLYHPEDEKEVVDQLLQFLKLKASTSQKPSEYEPNEE